MTVEFETYYGMTIDEAFARLEAAKLKNANEVSALILIAETPPTELKKQLEWARRCAVNKKIANDFINGNED